MSEKSLREQLVGVWTLNSYVERDVETGGGFMPPVFSASVSAARPDYLGNDVGIVGLTEQHCELVAVGGLSV
jgi:hypothetical protein